METSVRNSVSALSSNVVRIVVLMAVASMAMVGCVSQGKYDALMLENEKLQKQTRSLSGNVKLSQNVIAEKEKEKEQLKQELDLTSEQLAEQTERSEAAKRVYNRLVGELAGELENQQVTIQQMKSGVNVNLPANILFPSGSAKVSDSGQKVLDRVGKQLADVPYQTIVAGFTDNAPISSNLAKTFPSNWDLAAARATQVVRILQGSGVVSDRLVAVSFGENEPVAANDTKEGRQQNRRIEIRLRPIVK